MDMPTHGRGPPGFRPTAAAQPLNVKLIGNMYALTQDAKYLHQLEILANAGCDEAKTELRQLIFTRDTPHASGTTKPNDN
jgi:hypothetical protein